MRFLKLQQILQRAPRTLFAVTATGILVPSVLIGVLGLQSVRREQQLMRQEREGRYHGSIALLQEKGNALFETLAEGLSALAKRNSESPPSDVLSHTNAIAGYNVKQILLLEPNGTILWPQLPQVAPPPLDIKLDWSAYADSLTNLQSLEDYNHLEQALTLYRTLASKVEDPYLHEDLLKRWAACLQKRNDTAAIFHLYEDMILENPDAPTAEGMPAALTGRLLSGRYAEKIQNTDQAARLHLELLEGFWQGRWRLTQAALEESMEALSRLDLSSDHRSRWKALQDFRSQIEQRQIEASRFQELRWPVIVERFRNVKNQDKLILRESPSGDLVVSVSEMTSEGDKSFIVGIFDAKPIMQTATQTLDALAASGGLRIYWQKASPSDGVLFAHIILDSVSPPVAFDVSAPADVLTDPAAQKRLRLFEWIAASSLVAVLAGLVLIVLVIKQERSIARLKNDFVANVSHEIRTPLYAIAHIGERLDLGRYRSEDEKKKFYGILREETQRLRQLVEEALDFSRIMDGRMCYRRTRVDLAAIASEAERLFATKAVARGFQVDRKAPLQPLWVAGDERALVQATLNLLDNALKYSGDSRWIGLSVWNDKEFAHLTVQDKGIGIPKAEQRHIFEKFFRSQGAEKQSSDGGFGLGLTIVRHILEAHGGRVLVQSLSNQGSTFELVIPLYSAMDDVA